MEPKLPTPNISPERGPIQPGSFSPEVQQPGAGEAAKSDQKERIQEARERLTGAGAGDASSFQAPILPQVQAPEPVQASTTQQGMVNDDHPLVAADEDLIEREWVDKAKKIVAQTRDDPYAQEREVSRLQASYLQKRYGKDIKVSKE